MICSYLASESNSNSIALDIIPQIPSSGPLGHLKAYVADPLKFLQAQTQLHGGTFGFRLAGRHLVTTNEPDAVQSLLQSKHRDFRKNKAYRKLQLLLGQGLFTSEGDYWLQNRRLIQPAFHREQILGYFQDMQYYAKQLVANWRPACNTHQAVPLTEDMTQVTLQIIAKTVLGLDLDQQAQAVATHLPFAMQVMLKKITSPLASPMWLPTSTNRRFQKSVQVLDRIISEIITDRRNTRVKGNDLLSSLLSLRDEDSGKGLSDLQLRDEMMTFFLAGHETTAVALSWTIYTLLQHPTWLAQLQQEILEGLPRDYQPEDLQRIPSLLPIIQESMRLLPPVWILGREALCDTQMMEHHLPKGTSVIFSPYLIHRNPKYWEDPDEFKPHRFSQAGQIPSHKYAYFPFGGGPRLCIGNHFAVLEMQVILAEILKNYRLSAQNLAHPGFEYSITLRPAKPLYLQLSSI